MMSRWRYDRPFCLTLSTSDGVNQYGWNEPGRLSQISGGVTASFSYDVFGRRKDCTVNGHRMQTAWIDDELNLMVPDGDWSQRMRVVSPYLESGMDELTYRRIAPGAVGLATAS
ncbi:hypothetical protein BN2475_50050 [Paraburkholderia ribeironis]|uniref:Uncharacterized protein n=1 Tax=Paraburkholderia ribeironis TaxID=1247936 RepID=A0A1N7RK77_9BURK|nr:hypothetical protein [Paraburkholderia ribeironis]SIT35485.1 hypothetical protein BN2475_50050 [Paraburkholderia ribeironis]